MSDQVGNQNVGFLTSRLVCLTEEAGKVLATSLNKAGSEERALFVRCDISKQDDVEVCFW